jgi:hypothetical protein
MPAEQQCPCVKCAQEQDPTIRQLATVERHVAKNGLHPDPVGNESDCASESDKALRVARERFKELRPAVFDLAQRRNEQGFQVGLPAAGKWANLTATGYIEF